MDERGRRVDAYVAVAGYDSPAVQQCADILLSEQRNRRAVWRWVATVRAEFPECVVMAARHVRGRWCVLATRGATTFVVRASGSSTVDILAVELLARALYVRMIAEVDR